MFFVFFSMLLYFLPTLIARHKADAVGIFLVNLLFGWTVIGWVIALVWACAAEHHVYVPAYAVPVSRGRFCSQCGTLSAYGARFCSACGRAV
jgi:uncharacterized membrane protein